MGNQTKQLNDDSTRNWHGPSTGYQTQVSGTNTLNQNCTHNVVNEITNITETVGIAWPTPRSTSV